MHESKTPTRKRVQRAVARPDDFAPTKRSKPRPVPERASAPPKRDTDTTGATQGHDAQRTDRTEPYPTPVTEGGTEEAVEALRCSRCGSTGKLHPTYWDTHLCATCNPLVEAEFDRTGNWPVPWWDFPDRPKIAVWGGDGVRVGRHPVRTQSFSCVDDLCTWAAWIGVDQVWIHESALGDLLPVAIPKGAPAVPFLRADQWEDRGAAGRPRPHRKFWQTGGRSVHLIVPGWVKDNPFAGIPTSDRLMSAVARYDAAGGPVWHTSPGTTSDAWLRSHWRRGDKLRATERPDPVEHEWATETSFGWTRLPDERERGAKYGIALDVNSAYPAAAGSVELPAGPFEHRDFPTVDARLPGVWLIEPPKWDDPSIPAPWPERFDGGASWVTTPTAERCAQLGVEPIEAYVWPEHRRFLRGWSEMIRDARNVVADARWTGPERHAVKAVGVRGLGRLAAKDRAKGIDDELYQPYWDWAVIAEARCRLHRRLAKAVDKPVAIHVDCCYWLTDIDDPVAFAERNGLRLGGFGGLKPAGVVPASDVIDALDSLGGGLGRIVSLFGGGAK